MTFFGGKGGAGKTTCAAAAACRAANEGKTVLLVSTDPAHSLGDALDAKLGPKPVRVPTPGGELYAVQLDADKALVRWLSERQDAFRTIAQRGTYLDAADVDRLFSLSLPGVDELVGLIELARIARGRDYDRVVVDTAPTGHTVRLLEMPDTLKRFAQVLDDMYAKHRFLAQSLGGQWRPDFADQAISDMEEDAAELRATLADASRTSFTWVTLPEALPIAESEDGIRAIEALGIDVPTIVVNRVWPAPDRECSLCDARVVREGEQCTRVARLFGKKVLLRIGATVAEPRGVAALDALALSVAKLDIAATSGAPGAVSPTVPPPARTPSGSIPPPPSATTAGELLALPSGVRLVLVGGKGGVGKTSVACAAAIDLAGRDKKKRILLLSTDPAHSVGDALAARVSDDAARVPGAPANLHVRELDAHRAFEEEKKRYRAAIDQLFDSIFRGKRDISFDRRVLEDLLDLAPPGLDELFGILSIVDALLPGRVAQKEDSDRTDYDVVVVDTAPTGHTLRLLELPASALEWVNAIMSVILKYRRVVGLGDLASDLTALATQLRSLGALLVDRQRTAFVAVTRAGALPRLETERLVAKLKSLRVPLASVFVNALTTASCARCTSAAEAEAPHDRQLQELASRSRVVVVTAPTVEPPPRGPAELRAWCTTWSPRGMLPAIES